MRKVSEAYKQAMKEQFRNQSHFRISVGVFDLDAPTDAKLSSDGEALFSNLKDITQDNIVTTSYATFEYKGLPLDGDVTLVQDNGIYLNTGYVSLMLSDENGDFATIRPIVDMFIVNTAMVE